MPYVPTSTVINFAKITQYLVSRDIYLAAFYATQRLDKRHNVLLYLERKAVQNKFTIDPSDTTLESTSPYLLALCGAYGLSADTILAGSGCSGSFSDIFGYQFEGGGYVISGGSGGIDFSMVDFY